MEQSKPETIRWPVPVSTALGVKKTKSNSKLQRIWRNHLDTTFPVIKGMESMPFASQFQFAVRKISLVCHDCSETRRGDLSTKYEQSNSARQKNSSKTEYNETLTIKSLVHTLIHAKSSVYLVNSHPRMLPATI